MARAYRTVIIAIFLTLGCTGPIPYRTMGFLTKGDCAALYDVNAGNAEVTQPQSPCWLRSEEERAHYNLLFAEFDDQGWVQDEPTYSGGRDHLAEFFTRLNDIYDHSDGLSIIVFVHGWHHNAQANDTNVRNFRKLLGDIELLERAQTERGKHRVVGVYVGWRAESVATSPLNLFTFWDRKNTAERVAQGRVQDLLIRLDHFAYLKNHPRSELASSETADVRKQSVRMLTIGHSFGGLITFESLNALFLRNTAAYRANTFLQRVGDLVLIVNPAFEGARYESLRASGERLVADPTVPMRVTQLPTLIIATTSADVATGRAFPAGRFVSTLFETTNSPAEYRASLETVGHNARYETHTLGMCGDDDAQCKNACVAGDDVAYITRVVNHGFTSGTQTLCKNLKLSGPQPHPFWVVTTTAAIMKDHNDIFNEHFVDFIKQAYIAILIARHER